MKAPRDQHQVSQRLRVGLVGLAAVVLLIGLASSIIGSLTPGLPANDAAAVTINAAGDDAAAGGEPLAELGATPGGRNDQIAAAR